MLWFDPQTPLSANDLSPMGRRQLEIYGERLDGNQLSAQERMDPRNDGMGHLFGLSRWQARDQDGHVVFDLLHSDTDSGVVFHSSSERLLGLVIQFGFSATDLGAWEQLSLARRPVGFPTIDFSINDETGPTIVGGPAIGSAWRALRVVVAPWDESGEITRLLTASSETDAPGEVGLTGAPLAFFSALAVEGIHRALQRVPRDAVELRRDALASAVPDADYREPQWLTHKLDDLRQAVAAGEGLKVQVI